MPVCEICDKESEKCYTADLFITSDFDEKEAPFDRTSTICYNCRNKIINVFPKLEDEYF
ncbi:MAG TPA: hypothetical protein VJ697_15555 [Nitrososphaeraceae archaeon]|nr:hypothetical protein [Nitrososphaeraceae archaeon]